jgi:hypothetical protein
MFRGGLAGRNRRFATDPRNAERRRIAHSGRWLADRRGRPQAPDFDHSLSSPLMISPRYLFLVRFRKTRVVPVKD